MPTPSLDVQQIASRLSQVSDPIEANNIVIEFKENLKEAGLSTDEVEERLERLKDRIETRLLALNESTDPEGSFSQAARAAHRKIRLIVEMKETILVHLEEFGLYDQETTDSIPGAHKKDVLQIKRTLAHCLQKRDAGIIANQTSLAKDAAPLPEGEEGYLTIECAVKDQDTASDTVRKTLETDFPEVEFSISHP